jgi:hypothetical protein
MVRLKEKMASACSQRGIGLLIHHVIRKIMRQG